MRLVAGDWFVVCVGLLQMGAGAAYGWKRLWPESILYFAFGVGSFAMVAVSALRRIPT